MPLGLLAPWRSKRLQDLTPLACRSWLVLAWFLASCIHSSLMCAIATRRECTHWRPTGIAEQELRERWTAPFRRLAELLAADVRLASEVDECFDWLRVGRGHLLDATAYAVRARPAHFHALARAVVARYPASDTIEEDSCSLPGGRRGLQLGVGRHTVGQQLEASHPEVRRRCTGPTPIPVASAHIQHQGRRWCPRRSVGIHRLFANTCCIG
mmetsp:Transcript_164797/g.528737  ORF Transcript_164797/g.528737 Transcript_164797/m.528737 type:complete len:212 (-) Transcript_164797:311-946(-)